MSAPTVRVARLGPALVALGALAGVGAAPAHAHGGTAIVSVEQAAPGPNGVEVRVRVNWSDDGHAATDATVTGLLVGRDGAGSTPVLLRATDDQGRYAGVLPAAPGTWTLRVTVVRPPGVVEQPVEVPPPGTTVAAGVTTAAVTAPAAPAPVTTAPAAPAPVTTTPAAPVTTAPGRIARRSGVRWGLVLSIGVPTAVALGGAVVVMVGRRRNRIA
jgi:hypothetical protein